MNVGGGRILEDHDGHDDRADGDEERLKDIRQDDAEESAQGDVDPDDAKDDERRLPAREGQELLGELARPDGDEHQVADHQDEEEDRRGEPGRLGVAAGPEAGLVPFGEGHDARAADPLGLEGHVEADHEPAPEDVGRPERFEAEVEQSPDHGHRPADVDITRTPAQPEHPPGDVPIGQKIGVEPFRRPFLDDEADRADGDEVDAMMARSMGWRFMGPIYLTIPEKI